MALQGSTTARAQTPPAPESMETTRGLALGYGLRASAASTAALVYNPAGLSLGKLYHIEGSFLYQPQQKQYSPMAAIVDSMTSMLAAGLAVRGIIGDDGPGGRSGIDGRIGLSIPFSESFAIGIAGRYLSLNRAGPAPMSDPMMDKKLARGFTLDASVRLTLAQMVHLAALAYNLIKLDSPYAPVTLGGSAVVQLQNGLSFGTDVLFDLSTFSGTEAQIGVGAEYLAIGQVPVRIGYGYDTGRDAHMLTGGAGYVSDRLGADIAIRQQVSGGHDTTLMAAFRYFVQ